jgi:hypothetical protein
MLFRVDVTKATAGSRDVHARWLSEARVRLLDPVARHLNSRRESP